jgi:RHS repeat-associated protein
VGDPLIFPTSRGWVEFEPRLDGAPVASIQAPDSLRLRTETPRSKAGEILGRITPMGVATSMSLDDHRRVQSVGPSARSRIYSYSAGEPDQLTSILEPDGSAWSFTNYDGRNQPETITLPGSAGTIRATYDVLGRPKTLAVPFSGGSGMESFEYDGFDRVRRATSPAADMTFDYTLNGDLVTTLSVGADHWSWKHSAYPDGTHKSLDYPNGGEVAFDVRTPTGQLESIHLLNRGVSLISNVSYAMADAPAVVQMGPLVRFDAYDERRRLTSRIYARASSGEIVKELLYGYDEADREIVRQSSNRTDFFSYDADGRLIGADIGARPRFADELGAAQWQVMSQLPGSWMSGRYQRTYGPFTAADDLPAATVTSKWPGEVVPIVASTFAPADALGHLTYLDNSGAARTHDDLGNTNAIELPYGWVSLEHDGLSRLRKAKTSAGAPILSYGYRADGLRATREISCPAGVTPCAPGKEVLVYDGLRLLEVYETRPSLKLRARYYYLDETEVPVAADFLNPNTGDLEIHYLMTDRQGSVIGVVDAQGNWVERVDYDPWAQPEIVPADIEPPRIVDIIVEPTDTVAVRFSEPVLPGREDLQSNARPGSTLYALEHVIALLDPSQNRARGTWTYVEQYPNAARGSVLRFTPDGSTPPTAGANYGVELLADASRPAARLFDSWGNAAAPTTKSFNWSAGTYNVGPTGSTATAPVPASTVGNEVLLQSHSYEAVLGLYHMRGRVLDPFTNTFLEKDPYGYADAANFFAGFSNDPVNNRDPTGRFTKAETEAASLYWDCVDAIESRRSAWPGSLEGTAHEVCAIYLPTPSEPGALSTALDFASRALDHLSPPSGEDIIAAGQSAIVEPIAGGVGGNPHLAYPEVVAASMSRAADELDGVMGVVEAGGLWGIVLDAAVMKVLESRAASKSKALQEIADKYAGTFYEHELGQQVLIARHTKTGREFAANNYAAAKVRCQTGRSYLFWQDRHALGTPRRKSFGKPKQPARRSSNSSPSFSRAAWAGAAATTTS